MLPTTLSKPILPTDESIVVMMMIPQNKSEFQRSFSVLCQWLVAFGSLLAWHQCSVLKRKSRRQTSYGLSSPSSTTTTTSTATASTTSIIVAINSVDGPRASFYGTTNDVETFLEHQHPNVDFYYFYFFVFFVCFVFYHDATTISSTR
jgi:hypothetical protein